jgi:hypothetical protein
MRRRDFIKAAGATGAAIALCLTNKTKGFSRDIDNARTREYLRSLMPSREQVHDFVHGRQGSDKLSRNRGWTFDSDLGWILCDSIRPHSVDGSKGFYSYETDGARKVVNHPDKPCRIHTYGNSFTHCDQVSDGETWQEFLAAHLQEPIRNYGVGGYSVYQAYRRMLKVEKENGAEYIILNIWDDDHFRNLDSWRSIRFGHRTPCGYTLPYLQVNVQKDRCKQIENICRKPEDVYKLCNEDFVWKIFKDDPVLQLVLATRPAGNISQKQVKLIADSLGVAYSTNTDTETARRIKEIHTEAALYATKNVVTWTEQFVKKTGRKLMVILSFGQGNIAQELRGMPRFDRSFVAWLKDKPYPVIDMRDFFRADYKRFKVDINTYLKQYYIGHHNPAGNFFTAWAIKDQIVEWLEPPPTPYR